MYKLLVVDDEPIERDGLRMMIKQVLPNIAVVGEAVNGREAIEAVEQHRPDIVTMDIKMPGIDGLQAAREILKKHPAVKVVIFSAYDTFAYAKEAIQLGINDYVLKPYTKEEISKVIQRVIRMIEDDRYEQAEKLAITERYNTLLPLAETEWVSTLIFKHVHDISKQDLGRLLSVDDSTSYIVLFRFWREDNIPLKQEEQQSVYRMVKREMKRLTTCLVGPMTDQQIPVAVFDDEKAGHSLSHRSRATQLLRDFSVRFTSAPLPPEPLSYAVGVGRSVTSLEALRQSYQQSLAALRHIERPQQVQFYGESEQIGRATVSWVELKEKKLLEAVLQGDEQASTRLFDEFMAKMADVTQKNVRDVARYVTELFVMLIRMSGTDGIHHQAYTRFDTFSTLVEIREAAWHRLRQIIHLIEYRAEQQSHAFFDKANRYLEKHFHENISLETVARHVGLSSFYFSKLFKEHAGVTFIDYVTSLRVKKAKERLIESDDSLKKICFEVGYRDPNYFSRVFKKIAGMTPSAYRQKHSKKV